jgi:MFS family permease
MQLSTLDRQTWQKLMLLLVSMLVIMADMPVAPALPKIQSEFSLVENISLLVKMVLTLPALFIVVSAPLMGWLADKYGRKNVILAGIWVYIIAGAAGFFAGTIYELLVGRALLGVATAAIITGCSALIADYFKGDEISRMMGLQSTFIGYGGIIFLFMGGALCDISWRATFLIYLLPVVLLFFFAKFIDEPQFHKKQTAIDSMSWNNKFLKKIIVVYGIAFGVMIFFYMVPLQIPFYLNSIMDISYTHVGLTIGIMPLFSATTAIAFSRLKHRFSYRGVFLISSMIMGIGYMIIPAMPNYLFPALGLVFAGMAMGLVIPNMRAWIGSNIEQAFMGRAFGGLTTCLYLGQFFSPLIVNQVAKYTSIAASFSIAGAILFTLPLAWFLVLAGNNKLRF